MLRAKKMLTKCASIGRACRGYTDRHRRSIADEAHAPATAADSSARALLARCQPALWAAR